VKSLGNFPDPFWAEIAGQPDACRRAADGLAAASDRLIRVADLAAGRQPILTGMGSSYDACYPAVTELARAGVGAIHVDAAELAHFRTGLLHPSAAVVAVSQSGESAEVVRLARAIASKRERPPLIAVTNGTGNTLSGLADVTFDTRAGAETGPSTMTFAGSLVTMAAVARMLAGTDADDATERSRAEAEAAASSIERLLGDATLPDRLARWFADRGTVVILGRGPARAAAEMAALTLKEAVGIPVESLETAQFRHGPLELAGPELAVLLIATEPETLDLDLRFAGELAEAGVRVVAVTAGGGPPDGVEGVDLGPVAGPIAPAASVVPAQLLAWALAPAHGRTRGAYERASKVTTVE
jgi:glucosamine--fructose-6-phosphate aminotransferase (isomerizing)